MLIYLFLVLTSLAREPDILDYVGKWASVGKCEYQYSEFSINGMLTHYGHDGEKFVELSSAQWWEADGQILIGFKPEDYIGVKIPEPSLKFQLFSGTMIFSDKTEAEFVWERCD